MTVAKLIVAEQHDMEVFWIKIHPNWPRSVEIMGINSFMAFHK
jgi:hypothetical protein